MVAEPSSNSVEFITPILTLIVGCIGGIFLEKFKNRVVFLKKKIHIQLVASSANSPDWGIIEILYNGAVSNSLYTASIEIINDSSQDLDEFIAEFSVNAPAFIYRDSGQLIVDDVSKQLLWEESYRDYFLDVQKKNTDSSIVRDELQQASLQHEIDFVTRNKQYYVPSLNRGSKLIFHTLIDCMQGLPQVNVAVIEPGIKLVNQKDIEQEKKNRMTYISLIAGIIFIISAFPTIKYSPNITWAVWIMVINSMAIYVVAWPLYFVFFFLKRYVTS